MTKTKLMDTVIRPLKLMIAVSGTVLLNDKTFHIIGSSDAIDEDIDGINIPGNHIIKNEMFDNLNKDDTYEITADILFKFKEIESLTGKRQYDIKVYDDYCGFGKCIVITEDLERKVFIIARKLDNVVYGFTSFDILDKWMSCKEINSFKESELEDVIKNKVITMTDSDMSIRLSRNCFPFMGIVRSGSKPQFSGYYQFRPTQESGVGSFISRVKYKYLEAFHVYNFIIY